MDTRILKAYQSYNVEFFRDEIYQKIDIPNLIIEVDNEIFDISACNGLFCGSNLIEYNKASKCVASLIKNSTDNGCKSLSIPAQQKCLVSKIPGWGSIASVRSGTVQFSNKNTKKMLTSQSSCM